ncbi:MAG: hypothetical protein EXQ79_10615 [Acidimicrobiia bacterium]|nr:hypothetical protein [Acidimicrobiia bacterium]
MTTDPRVPMDKRFAPPTPFARLMWAHAASAAADACIAASLVGSLFFASPASSSREKLLLYLVISFAPFAIIWPLLGPALDRSSGGRRLVVTLSLVGRAVLCIFMSRYITKEGSDALLMYPLAFGVLVLQKSYSVAKSSLLPGLVDDEAGLVRANSRLALASVIASFAGAAPAALLQVVADADWSLVFAAFVFVTATMLSLQIPKVAPMLRSKEEIDLEQEEMHLPSVLLSGSAMGVLRGAAGFLAFFSAFALKKDIVGLGFVGGFAFGGAFLGNLCAPMLRERVREEVLLASALATAAFLVLAGAVVGGVPGFALSGLAIGVGAASGKLGFDSLLQRDAPDAIRGRAFARFETRFQAMWAIGALLGLIPLNRQVGLMVLAGILVFVALSYTAGLRAARGRVYRTTVRPKVVDDLYGKAKSEVTAWGRRSAKRRRRPSRKTEAQDDTVLDVPHRPSRRQP